jgi:plasmid maintenance system antidote protein VapI
LAAILDKHQPVTPALAPRLALFFTTAAVWLTVRERHGLETADKAGAGQRLA